MLVWVTLSLLHGCRCHVIDTTSLPEAVEAVRRHAEGCKTFDDLVRQAPVDLDQVRGVREAWPGIDSEGHVTRWFWCRCLSLVAYYSR